MDLSSKLIITTLSICAAAWAVMNAILVKKLIEAERRLDQLETRISLLANSDSHDRKRLMDKARALNTPSGRRRAKQRSARSCQTWLNVNVLRPFVLRINAGMNRQRIKKILARVCRDLMAWNEKARNVS